MTNHTDTHSLYVLIVSLAYRWFSIPSRLHTQLLVWSPSFSNAPMRCGVGLGLVVRLLVLAIPLFQACPFASAPRIATWRVPSPASSF